MIINKDLYSIKVLAKIWFIRLEIWFIRLGIWFIYIIITFYFIKYDNNNRLNKVGLIEYK